MKQSDIPIYNDPVDFEVLGESAKYPCSTQFMVYNPLLHRYCLTPEALEYYGLDAERLFIGDGPDAVKELIDKVSKKVYDYINYKAGYSRYQVMMYRIATAPKTIYPDQYFMRKQFEEALIDQARYMIASGDAARYSRANFESEMVDVPPKPEDHVKDFSDLSPECIRTLEALNLTKWFGIAQSVKPDLSRY